MANPANDLVLKVSMRHTDARPLIRQSGSAGYDISACVPVTIYPHAWGVVPTGIHMVIPKNYVGMICSRSGIAVNHGVTTQAGIIDSDYRGEVKVSKGVY